MDREIKFLAIHCSATPNGRPHTAKDIDSWHKARGFRRDPKLIGFNNPDLRHIGYHYVIYVNGIVQTGRGEREAGAHIAGFNANSIGICMIGTDRYTPQQWDSLKALVSGLQRRFRYAEVRGHRDFSPDLDRDGIVEPHEWLKTCPGFDVSAWLAHEKLPAPGHILELSPNAS